MVIPGSTHVATDGRVHLFLHLSDFPPLNARTTGIVPSTPCNTPLKLSTSHLSLLFPVFFPGPDWCVLGEEVWGTTGHSCSPTLDPMTPLSPPLEERRFLFSLPTHHPQCHTPSPPRPQVLLTHLLDDPDHPAAPQLLQGGAQCANGPEPQAAETLQRWETGHMA